MKIENQPESLATLQAVLPTWQSPTITRIDIKQTMASVQRGSFIQPDGLDR